MIRALRAYVRTGWRTALIFRANLFVGLVGIMIQIALTVTVWRVVYANRPAVRGVGIEDAVAYAALAACLAALLVPFRFSQIPERVRTGVIANDVIRPLGVIPQSLATNAGTSLAAIPRAAAGFALALLLGAFRPPESAGAAVAFAVSVAAGWCIAMMMNLAVSMVAFWTLETRGAFHIYRTVAAFFSGVLVPLWFMPDWLRIGLEWLPFQAQVFTPLSIYLGRLQGPALWQALAVQLGWIVVMYGMLRLIAWRALRKVVVQGG